MENIEKTSSPGGISEGSSLSSGLINGLSGLLSKGVDTALDVWAIRESGKVIGSVYPTGQTDPATVKAAEKAEIQSVANTQSNVLKYMPWIIGGGVLIVGGFMFLSLKNASK